MGQPQKSGWKVDLRTRDPETGERFWDEDFAEQQTIQAYLECASMQNREGGTFIIAPLRTQIDAAPDSLSAGEKVWANIGLVIQHTFTPPVKPRTTNGNGHPATPPAVADVAPGLDPDDDLEYEDDDDDMRDADERAVAAELDEGDEPDGVFPQGPVPVGEPPYVDEDAELSRITPADLMPKVQ